MSKGSDNNKNNWNEFLRGLNRNTLGMIFCAFIILLALVVFFLVRGGERKAPSKELKENEAVTQIGDNQLSAVEKETKPNKRWSIMTDDEYGIEISSLDGGFTGAFVEDGSDETVKKIYALVFTNNSEQDIQYGEYVFKSGKELLSFKFSNLPAGQSCLVMEADRHSYKKKKDLSLVSRVVSKVDYLPFAREELLIVDNSDDTITVMNLTEKEIPVARVFYKSFDEEENRFVGGITYTARAESIPAGSGVTLSSDHFKSGVSVIVGSGIYDS